MHACTHIYTQTVSRAFRLTRVESGTINRSVQRNLVPRCWDFFSNCGSQEPKIHNNPLFRQEGFRGDMMLSISLLTVQSSSVLRQAFSLQTTKKLVKDSHIDVFRGLKANSLLLYKINKRFFFLFCRISSWT